MKWLLLCALLGFPGFGQAKSFVPDRQPAREGTAISGGIGVTPCAPKGRFVFQCEASFHHNEFVNGQGWKRLELSARFQAGRDPEDASVLERLEAGKLAWQGGMGERSGSLLARLFISLGFSCIPDLGPDPPVSLSLHWENQGFRDGRPYRWTQLAHGYARFESREPFLVTLHSYGSVKREAQETRENGVSEKEDVFAKLLCRRIR